MNWQGIVVFIFIVAMVYLWRWRPTATRLGDKHRRGHHKEVFPLDGDDVT